MELENQASKPRNKRKKNKNLNKFSNATLNLTTDVIVTLSKILQEWVSLRLLLDRLYTD